MALAWIAWRNIKSVRDHCSEYRENWFHWVPGSWNVPTSDGTGFERIDGYELKLLRHSTTVRLAFVERYLVSTRNLPVTTQMAVSKAEKQLFAALAAGRIVAIGWVIWKFGQHVSEPGSLIDVVHLARLCRRTMPNGSGSKPSFARACGRWRGHPSSSIRHSLPFYSG
ncbi:hypothetical protein [Bradyrhizobium sp. 141]|uniref:hypothetical protein n=1 Tax=Bradyrhizobium sp. 141 TaxID=2782617 RepID=UPI001FFA046C|nr:hypothetical protein [Bradyrhizobium sp. 141]MCK1723759.1 hypothetical protein [Bradyrhizobium sp. 141]